MGHQQISPARHPYGPAHFIVAGIKLLQTARCRRDRIENPSPRLLKEEHRNGNGFSIGRPAGTRLEHETASIVNYGQNVIAASVSVGNLDLDIVCGLCAVLVDE